MKKYLSILCALALMAGFAACGSKDDDDDKEEKTKKESRKDDDDDDDDEDDEDDAPSKSDIKEADSEASTIEKAVNSALTDLEEKGDEFGDGDVISYGKGELTFEDNDGDVDAEDLYDQIAEYVDDLDEKIFIVHVEDNVAMYSACVEDGVCGTYPSILDTKNYADYITKSKDKDKLKEAFKAAEEAYEENKGDDEEEETTKKKKDDDEEEETTTKKAEDKTEADTTKASGGNDDKEEALEQAKTSVEYSDYSYDGLVSALEDYYEFSHDAAVYAADNCGADWDEEALESAQSYIEYSEFSYADLVDQLIYEQFTEEQAKKAVDNCGADWKEEAVQEVESYIEYDSTLDKDTLYKYLTEYDGYTKEEAEYALQKKGF